MDNLELIEVLKLGFAVFGGFVIHWVMLSPRINKLTDTIEHLTKTVDKLETKVEGVNELRREITALEIRVSDNEAEIRVMNKYIDFTQQDIT